jgi:hypothetical protein
MPPTRSHFLPPTDRDIPVEEAERLRAIEDHLKNRLIVDGTTLLTVSATAPVDPRQGDLWVDIS